MRTRRAGIALTEAAPRRFGLAPGLDEVSAWLIETRLERRGWRRVRGPGWNLLFYGGLDPPRSVYGGLEACQAVNHLPGTVDAFDKIGLYRNLRRLRRRCGTGGFSLEGDVMPESFELPVELAAFKNAAAQEPDATWVHKPRFGAQGRELSLVSTPDEVRVSDKWMLQRYLDRPMLYRECKFNLRVFALITSVEPLELFIYREGYLDRAARAWNPADRADMTIHNTNSEFQASQRTGPDGDLSIPLSRWLAELATGGDDPGLMWDGIRTLVLMALLSGLHVLVPIARRSLPHPRNCFELLGLDILVDEGRRPWLIECNRSPSLTTDFIPDIKIGLVDDLLSLLEARLFGEGPQAATAQGFEPLAADPAMVARLVSAPDD